MTSNAACTYDTPELEPMLHYESNTLNKLMQSVYGSESDRFNFSNRADWKTHRVVVSCTGIACTICKIKSKGSLGA